MFKKLQAALVKAMREKDEVTKAVIRNIKVQIEKKQQERVMKEKPEDAAASKRDCPLDSMVVASVRKEVKELFKAIKELPDTCSLVEDYKKQVDVCLCFLPIIDTDETAVNAAVNTAIEELAEVKAKTPEIKVGMIIGHVMRNNKTFPGSLVKRLVSERVGS